MREEKLWFFFAVCQNLGRILCSPLPQRYFPLTSFFWRNQTFKKILGFGQKLRQLRLKQMFVFQLKPQTLKKHVVNDFWWTLVKITWPKFSRSQTWLAQIWYRPGCVIELLVMSLKHNYWVTFLVLFVRWKETIIFYLRAFQTFWRKAILSLIFFSPLWIIHKMFNYT